MKKIFIGLVILLVLCGCNSNTEYVEPSREEITADDSALGKKDTDVKPIVLVNKEKETVYVGEKDYDFGVEAYSDNGEVEIKIDDSNVDYDKAGTYEVKVIVADNNEAEEIPVELENKTKPVIHNNTGGTGGAVSEQAISGGGTNTSGYSYYAPQYNKTFYSKQEFLNFLYIQPCPQESFINTVSSWDEETWIRACVASQKWR